jgi:hypothetical protein
MKADTMNQGNVEGWNAGEDENVGIGSLGACCAEMDIWGKKTTSHR